MSVERALHLNVFEVFMEVEMKIRGLMMDPVSNMPIVLLKDVGSDTVLPIWVGVYEANAIALEIEKELIRVGVHGALEDDEGGFARGLRRRCLQRGYERAWRRFCGKRRHESFHLSRRTLGAHLLSARPRGNRRCVSIAPSSLRTRF